MTPNRTDMGRNKHYTRTHATYSYALKESAKSGLVRGQYRINDLTRRKNIRICFCSDCVCYIAKLFITLILVYRTNGVTFLPHGALAPVRSATGSSIEVTPSSVTDLSQRTRTLALYLFYCPRCSYKHTTVNASWPSVDCTCLVTLD